MKRVEPDNEVLEFAINREQEAHNFYTALAERIDIPAMKKILKDFAQEELEHKAKLELELIKGGIVVDTTKAKPIRISDYVVSNEPSINIDYKDLLEICIQKEDASYRLYADLLLRTPDQDSKETLLALMEEEIKHKLRFEIEYENISKTF